MDDINDLLEFEEDNTSAPLLSINRKINEYNSIVYDKREVLTNEYKLEELEYIDKEKLFKKLSECDDKKKKIYTNINSEKELIFNLERVIKVILDIIEEDY